MLLKTKETKLQQKIDKQKDIIINPTEKFQNQVETNKNEMVETKDQMKGIQ